MCVCISHNWFIHPPVERNIFGLDARHGIFDLEMIETTQVFQAHMQVDFNWKLRLKEPLLMKCVKFRSMISLYPGNCSTPLVIGTVMLCKHPGFMAQSEPYDRAGGF